ncbi:hypothetical protein H4R20_002096 [Coemansia guatemalensis]|uniref:R3H domain-containing protein n=1 Tax=Coemansia guatemalensis TaxID=2761395 RepID=A0A9W8HVT2_9FUNG|nr:hypothetical protein H4R20_002096 [Coemansia guatemalensis]
MVTPSIVDPILAHALGSNESDRHFVLDSEQMVWDFVAQSQQRRLLLPKQNSYRRLLLHKLADYYNLVHVVVGKQRDEIAFYKKTTADAPCTEDAPEPLGKRVPLEMDHAEDESDTVDDSVGAGFTHILLKKPRSAAESDIALVEGPAERNVRDPRDFNLQNTANAAERCLQEAVGIKGKSIEQRQAEYERARAEIFQDNATIQPSQAPR